MNDNFFVPFKAWNHEDLPFFAAKWEQTGLLRNLEGLEKFKMVVILERSARYLLGKSPLTPGNISDVAKFMFPLVRRTFANLDYEIGFQADEINTGVEFNLEMMNDFTSYYALDAEVEFVQIKSEELVEYFEGRKVIVGQVPLSIKHGRIHSEFIEI